MIVEIYKSSEQQQIEFLPEFAQRALAARQSGAVVSLSTAWRSLSHFASNALSFGCFAQHGAPKHHAMPHLVVTTCTSPSKQPP